MSPDGRTIAYVGARVDGPEPHDLYLQPVDGAPSRNITATSIDRPIAQPKWLNNDSLAVLVSRGFASELVELTLDGRARPVERLNVNPTLFAVSQSGVLAYVGETATRAPELWIRPPGGGPRGRSPMSTRSGSRLLVATPEIVKYKSADGVEIEAALLRPPGPFGACARSSCSCTADRPAGGPTASNRGASCSRRAATSSCIRTSAAPRATARRSSR